MAFEKTVVVSKKEDFQRLANNLSNHVYIADDSSEALDIIKTTSPQLVLFDYSHTSNNFRDFVSQSNSYISNIPIVIIGTESDNSNTLQDKFTQMGAKQYLHFDNNPEQLQQIINEFNEENEDIEKTDSAVPSQEQSTEFFINDIAQTVGLVGKSLSIINTINIIKLVAESQVNPILIIGETGTGKEIAAKAVHTLRNPNEQMVSVNCAALTSTLLESELFGHVKGAFTGADCDKTGLLELAGKGTILLDEISEMPIQLQAKLLRVLEDKSFRKVGGTKTIHCNATIIAASNRNLIEEVRQNRFRRDLYYRLNISPIIMSPLKSSQRRDDIYLLAKYFLKTSNICPDKSKKIMSLTNLATEALVRHDWPGNVRELRNVIDRAILLETTDKIGLSDIVFDPFESGDVNTTSLTAGQTDFSLEKAEKELISRALDETSWQKTRAANLLGITRATLYAKLKQYNIEKQSGENQSCMEQPDNDFSLSSY